MKKKEEGLIYRNDYPVDVIMMVGELSDMNFDSVVRANAFVLVDCYTVWCGPCKQLTPTIEQFARQHPIVKVFKLDIEKNPKAAQRFGIQSVPTLLFFEKGQLKDKKSGALDLSTLKRLYGR